MHLTSVILIGMVRRRYVSHRFTSHRFASHGYAFSQVASHRFAFSQVASLRFASHRLDLTGLHLTGLTSQVCISQA
jgi:hypothetical protein